VTRLDVTREQFRERADVAEPAVVHAAATLDVDASPLAAYAALAGDSPSFLLESAGKTAGSDPDGAFRPSSAVEERHARFSFVGYDPDAIVSVGPDETSVEVLGGASAAAEYVTPEDGDVLDTLRGALPDLPRRGFPERDRQLLTGGLVGFLAYDAVYDLWLEERGVERPDSPVPDAEFVLTTKTLAFDHAADEVSLVCTPVVEPDTDVDALYDDLSAAAERVASALADADAPDTGGFERDAERAGPREEYEAAVRETKQHVLDGDVYQGVISRRRELDGDLDPLGLYASLREVNPSPYMYVLDHGPRTIVGASPETLVSVRGREVMANPIAGTCPRGTSPVEDRRLAGEMLADDKERAEHTMLVDLARNDVRRVSEAGSVRVPEFMSVLKYSHVQHIESTVTGRLRGDCDAFDAVRAAFPAGTLSGAPKIRAMEIIDDLERRPRGVYGGGVGYVSWDGDADVAIVIRTATVDSTGDTDTVTVQAGAGVVADSDPAAEYDETEQKMDGVLAALDDVERSDSAPETEAEVSR
jgi:anthranilate synthase component 1